MHLQVIKNNYVLSPITRTVLTINSLTMQKRLCVVIYSAKQKYTQIRLALPVAVVLIHVSKCVSDGVTFTCNQKTCEHLNTSIARHFICV